MTRKHKSHIIERKKYSRPYASQLQSNGIQKTKFSLWIQIKKQKLNKKWSQMAYILIIYFFLFLKTSSTKFLDENEISLTSGTIMSPSCCNILEENLKSEIFNETRVNLPKKNAAPNISGYYENHLKYLKKLDKRLPRSLNNKMKNSITSSNSSAEAAISSADKIECPTYEDNSACPCYKFEDGLFLECPGTTTMSLRTTLEGISSPIHSLSIYDFDRAVSSLSQDVFHFSINVKHLQFSHSHLETLKDNSLKNVRASLESLSIVNGKLKQIPTRALSLLQKLLLLDFDYNEITKIDDYSFFGLHLTKLNLKGNKLQTVSEHGLAGVENTMLEIDLSENYLRTFPMLSLRKLRSLRILRLANNKISTFDGEIQLLTNNATATASLNLPSLMFLDLSSNQFTELIDNGLRAFPQLKTLTLYSNQIEIVHPESFHSLKDLMSLDMSHNRIIALDYKTFEKNTRLHTIDLSHNHIHSINGVFSNLPQLREIFLSENNILELAADAFTNSTNVDVIYLESNAISHVHPNVFSSLTNLKHLYLRSNFIPQLPVTLFDKCHKLTTISMDKNEIQDLEIGMFRKLEHLREIRLHDNHIKRIRKGVFDPLPDLHELLIQKNNIEDIEPGAFASLSKIQHINLQDNKLTVLEDIFPKQIKNNSLLSIRLESNFLYNISVKTFAYLNRIQIMWLSDNEISKLEKHFFKDTSLLGRLYLRNNRIQEIEKDTLINLKNLKFLDLSGNCLNLLKRHFFYSLHSLEELIISNNFVEAIENGSFNNLKHLRILDLSHNPLIQISKDLFLTELPLTFLNLANTSLQKIDINALNTLQNLNEINLENNFLSPKDIQYLDLPGLRILYLSQNNFSISRNGGIFAGIFDRLRSLQYIAMQNCSITQIPDSLFNKNTNLVKIDLCANNLSNIKNNIFSGLNVFKELRICQNNISDFPHIALFNLTTLETLDLSNNHLSHMDFFKLRGTLNLRQLDLNNNKISSLSGFNTVNLTQLDSIDLSGNHLFSLPTNFLKHSLNLQRVDLSRNRFVQIPISALSAVSIPRLMWLNFSANPINKFYTVREEKYPYLKELYICQTNLSILTSKDFEPFQSLQHLHLTYNRISRISPGAFNTLDNLLTLDLSINELELLPKERLQGLKRLRLLNVSHNSLKDLEEFSMDLAQLEICDISYNQIDRLSKKTFRNLRNLIELFAVGNRITAVSNDAFRFLRKLQVLDLRKNYFENIPVDALKLLEPNLKTLNLAENPLHCSCDAQNLWEWLRDHRKWSSLSTVALKVTEIPMELGSNYLRCEQPSELRGKIFVKMETKQFCDAPIIPKIAIQDIQPYSVVVSWQSREYLGLMGYEIVYHSISDTNFMKHIHGKRRNGTVNSAKLTKLAPNTRYHICVIGMGNWISERVVESLKKIHYNDSSLVSQKKKTPMNSPHQNTTTPNKKLQHETINDNTIGAENPLMGILKSSHVSTCTDVQTLDSTPSLISDDNGLTSDGFIHSMLTRRLGLIVGCCLGIVVFIVMISVLSYVKFKKQRTENAKREVSLPPEYISYRHFSIPNEELLRASGCLAGGTAPSISSVPSGISVHISRTSLSTSTTTATTPIANTTVKDMEGGRNISTVGFDGYENSNSNSLNDIENLNTTSAISIPNDVITVAATVTSHNNLVQHRQYVTQLQCHQLQHNQGNLVDYMNAELMLEPNNLSAC